MEQTIPNGTQIGPFIIGRLLLPPSNGEIYECALIDPQNQEEAEQKFIAKLVYKNTHPSELEAETFALNSLNHYSLIHPFDIQDFPNFRLFYFPRYTDGDLLDYIIYRYSNENCISEESLARFFYLVANGLSYMHNSGFMHRDVKPENILLNSMQRIDGTSAFFPIIIDFGFTVQIPPGEYLTEAKGTPAYAAPEVLMSQPYSYPADVWSYGVTLFTAIAGHNPFNIDLNNVTYDDFDTDNLIDELTERGVSESFQDLIQQLFNIDPESRPTFDDIMEHPWFHEYYPQEERELDDIRKL